MAGPHHLGVAGIVTDRCHHLLRDRDVVRIERPGDDQYGHRQFVETIPQRLLCSGAREAQARCQSRGGVAQPFCAVSLGRQQMGEQRLRQPLVDERFDADLFDPISQRLVAPNALAPRRGIDDSAGCTDEHETSRARWVIEGQAHAQSPAHRISDVDAIATLVREIRSGRGHVERECRGVAVAGRIEGASFEARVEQFVERRPASARLREAVHENDPIRHGDNRRLAW